MMGGLEGGGGHVKPQYHCGFGRIAIKLQLTSKSHLIFNPTKSQWRTAG